MKEIEKQLRVIDSYERMQYRNHLTGLTKTATKNDTQRYENIIQLIDKINQE